MSASRLAELIKVQQRTGEGYRRCFGSDCFDLWLWYSDDNAALTGFQLVWDDSSLAITWTSDHGFSFRTITPEGSGMKMTNLLDGEAGAVDPLLIPIFKRYAEGMDEKLVSFIVEKIMISTGITQEVIDAAEREHPDLSQHLLWR